MLSFELPSLDQDETDMAIRLVAALAAGAIVGLERSFHGRPAGFRTHALVSLASAVLMLLTSFQERWFAIQPEIVRVDPARMAQGIMTGVGFIGAGVIFKEGLTVRGLTTAASLWVTAALGIVYGAGLYFAAVLGTAATLLTLSAFRVIENWMPSEIYANLTVRCRIESHPTAKDLQALLAEHGFSGSHLGYARDETAIEHRMQIVTMRKRNAERLAEALCDHPGILGFTLIPVGSWD